MYVSVLLHKLVSRALLILDLCVLCPVFLFVPFRKSEVMASSNRHFPGNLPILDGKNFAKWRIQMRVVKSGVQELEDNPTDAPPIEIPRRRTTKPCS